MTVRALAIVLLTLCGLCGSAAGAQTAASPQAAANPKTDNVRYEVKAGDDLYGLARLYFRSITDYRTVQRLNRVADPHRIPVRRTLLIPKAVLRFKPLEARVIAFRGDVRIARGGVAQPGTVGAVVREGDAIQTGTNAFVSLGLPDDSVVSLPSRSEVRVARLRQWYLTNNIERLFELVTGRVRGLVEPLKKPGDDFRFATPSAVSAVRGTELRVVYDAATSRSATEVVKGHVGVSAGAEEAAVMAGSGVIADGKQLGQPIPLLAPPSLIRPGAVQDADALTFHVEPLAGAVRYRLQIAKDAGFVDVVSEVDAEAEAVLPSIEDGNWFVRVAGIDANGLEGMPRTYSFSRRRNVIATETGKRTVGKYSEFLFRWRSSGEGKLQYRFQLSRQGDKGPPLVDEVGLADSSFVITDLPPGTYEWRVMTLQFVEGEVNRKWSDMETLTISPSE